MKHLAILAVLALAAPASAEQTPPSSAAQAAPVRMEYYYRIKWGSAERFALLEDHWDIVVTESPPSP